MVLLTVKSHSSIYLLYNINIVLKKIKGIFSYLFC